MTAVYRGRHEVARLPAVRRRTAPRRWPAPVVVLASAALAYAGTIVRWLRPFALVVLGCVALAVAAGPMRTPLLLLALPAAAVVLGAAIDAAASTGHVSRHVRPTPVRTAASAGVVLLAGAALVLTAPKVSAATPSGPARALESAPDSLLRYPAPSVLRLLS